MVEKEVGDIFEKVEKKSLKLPPKIVKLSRIQKEIIHLVSDEFLTIKQIAERRKCSLQAVYKIITKIKEKGFLDGALNKVEKVPTTFHPTDIRLHGQELNIRILWQDNKYQELLNKSNTLFLDGNTIRLYKNSIEIYSGQTFFGKEVNDAEKRSLEYLQRFLARLEHELKIGIIKNKARNIKIVNQHFARGDSEIADNAIKNRERVWVYAEEDGKLAFITDDSFGFKEDETVHPITGKPDRLAVDKQVNDWRLNNPPTNSELAGHIRDLTYSQQTESDKWNFYAQHIESHTKAIIQLSNKMGQLVNIKKENIKLKRGIQGSQTKLGEFF
jgi:DNA-binding Lrp family transcriptional regulator